MTGQRWLKCRQRRKNKKKISEVGRIILELVIPDAVLSVI
jgi:hypothetical protein